MICKIKYSLTEAAQRAAMVATGQPVPRTLEVSENVPEELLASPLAKIADDGSVEFDLAASHKLQSTRWGIRFSKQFDNQPANGVDAIKEFSAAMAAEQESVHKEDLATAEKEAIEKAKQDAANAAETAQAEAEFEAFLADPSDRAASYYDATIHGRSFRLSARKAEMHVEIKRRTDADVEAKAAEKATKEQAKLAYIADWIGKHGSESQRARIEDGFLCREEAISAIADQAFAAASGLERHSDPIPDCEYHSCEDCDLKTSIEPDDKCLNEEEYGRYSAVRAALPAASLSNWRHTASHDCEHDGCYNGYNRSVLAKLQVGPFSLKRRFAL